MKKVLSLLLAVVLVCSMATVAFAMNYSWTCDVCGGETGSAAEYDAHVLSGKCGTCAHCGKGFSKVTNYKDEAGKEHSDLSDHEYVCPKANIFCDYCGETKASEKDYADHIKECKAKHFYLPIGLIIKHVKEYIGKIDFKKAFEGGKNFFGYVINIGKDIAGNLA